MSNEVAYIGRCPHGEVIAVATRDNREAIAEQLDGSLEYGFVPQILSPGNPAPATVGCLSCAKGTVPAA